MNKLQEKMKQARIAAEELVQQNFLKHKVSVETQKERFDICSTCEHLKPTSNQCKVCGCFMGIKTWMPNQKCPLDKWGKVEVADADESI
jgi:hypothetical protein